MDLHPHFADLNSRLFDGQLGPIELRWRHTKGRGGLFVCNTVLTIQDGKRTYKKVPLYIEVSSYFGRTEDDVRGILAHEMIHYYLAQNNIRDDASHGTEFHRMLRKLNAKGVVSIPFMVNESDI